MKAILVFDLDDLIELLNDLQEMECEEAQDVVDELLRNIFDDGK